MADDDLPRVPKSQWDVFISYAHIDNEPDDTKSGWVDGFYTDFNRRLAQRLGGTPQIFFDNYQLRKGEDFKPRIKYAIQQSALFIAIVSNSYLNRRYCVQEYQCLEDYYGGSGGLRLSRGSRCLEVIADVPTGWTNETKLVQGSAGYRFCNNSSRYRRSDQEYKDAIETLTSEVQMMLDELSEPYHSVVMPRPSGSDSEDRDNLQWQNFKALRRLCHEKGRRIVPRYLYYREDELIRGLQSADFSVYFLGTNEDELRSIVQIAVRGGRPVAVIVGKDDIQKSFVWELTRNTSPKILQCQVAKPDSLPALKDTILSMLLGGGERAGQSGENAGLQETESVYLICHDPSDSAVRLWIEKITNLNGVYHLPQEVTSRDENPAPSPLAIKEANATKLKQSAKIALLWGDKTSGQWFRQQVPVVNDASAVSKRRAVHMAPPKTPEKDGVYAIVREGESPIQVIYSDDDATHQSEQIDRFLST